MYNVAPLNSCKETRHSISDKLQVRAKSHQTEGSKETIVVLRAQKFSLPGALNMIEFYHFTKQGNRRFNIMIIISSFCTFSTKFDQGCRENL